MFLPRWFFFHLDKVSYWSRTVMVPLFILCSLRVQARNPNGVGVAELFVRPPEDEPRYFRPRSRMNRVYLLLDQLGRRLEPLIPSALRRRAIAKAEAWFIERLNGDSGLGAIFPAMVNAYEALDALGYPPDHPLRRTAKEALEELVVEHEDDAYCQPCVSPVWDTALAAHALLESGGDEDPDARRALDWLVDRQITETVGDWAAQRPDPVPGGWAFQYRNDYYPDLDDTAMVAWAMDRAGDPARYAASVRRAADWVRGLQSMNGGFAAFDADNTHYHLNEIPFADHGALLDPPTADVSARVLALLGRLERSEDREALRHTLDYLLAEQEDEGPWYGRWGTNFIYGTWSVVSALRQSGHDMQRPEIRRAVAWLKSMQRPDGGWGETNDTYEDEVADAELIRGSNHGSTAFQTAWALLALIDAGEGDSPEVRRGVRYLMDRQESDGLWSDPWYTAPGFPRVFYLKYHGYTRYFPLWALARYRNEVGRGATEA